MNITQRSLWHGKTITLADKLDLTGQKPLRAVFRGKTFNYDRKEGWRALMEDITKELYRIDPASLIAAAKAEQEYLISDEPVCWAVRNRQFAENYEDAWWAEIADNVYIYTKNNTNKKMENLRSFFADCGVSCSELTIVLY